MSKTRTIHLPVVVSMKDGKGNRVRVKPGEPLKVSEEEAKTLLARWGSAPAKTVQPEPKVEKPQGAALRDALVAAMKNLDSGNEDHFTRSGKPNVAVLEDALGYNVTAAERDDAWAVLDPAK